MWERKYSSERVVLSFNSFPIKCLVDQNIPIYILDPFIPSTKLLVNNDDDVKQYLELSGYLSCAKYFSYIILFLTH